MKKILVPTDFSKAAMNATEYAAQMAVKMNAQLVLLHIYSYMPPALDLPVVITLQEDLEKNSMAELKKIKKRIEKKYGKGLTISMACRNGFVQDEILNFATSNKIDLIVMGMQGGGYIPEHIIGSSTTSVIHRSHCPVLSIKEKLWFKPVKNIALACDYMHLNSQSVLKPLKELVTVFKSRLFILHGTPELKLIPIEKEKAKVNATLRNLNPTFINISTNNLVGQINQFVTNNKIDMLVMIPRKHTILDALLYEPDTKRMAFHAKVPLLTLHE